MAITHSYVDYGAGSDATGDGTIGTPWKTLQHAFDTLTRNTTDGNQINLKAGTAHVNSAALALTTFIAGGALAVAAPLILRGYTSAANDGGIGEIDCGGATMFAATTYKFVMLVDLEIHTFGDNHGIQLGTNCIVEGCEIHKGASSPTSKRLISIADYANVIRCYVHDIGTTGFAIYGASSLMALNNYINIGASDSIGIVGQFNTVMTANYNVILANHVGADPIKLSSVATTFHTVIGNICYNVAAGTGYGITLPAAATRYSDIIMNNIVVGWSGAGGVAIGGSGGSVLIGHNAFYNNTADYSLGEITFLDLTANDVALAADPFTDAANGDFSLTAAAKTALASKGFPISYLGAHANTVPNLNIGPIQLAASAGGGGRPAFGDRTGGKF